MRDYFNDRQNDSKVAEKIEAFPFYKFCMHTVDNNGTRCKQRKIWNDEIGALRCPNTTHKPKKTIFDVSYNEIRCFSCFLVSTIDSKVCIHCDRKIKEFSCNVCDDMYINTAELTGKNAHCVEEVSA